MADWDVTTVETSQATGGLAIQGVNNCARDEIDRMFSWNIGHHSLRPGSFERFDFSKATFGPGARERFESLRKLALKG